MPPILEIKNYREYFNKGHRCIWVQLHDGSDHKLIVTDEPSSPQLLHSDDKQTPESQATRPDEAHV